MKVIPSATLMAKIIMIYAKNARGLVMIVEKQSVTMSTVYPLVNAVVEKTFVLNALHFFVARYVIKTTVTIVSVADSVTILTWNSVTIVKESFVLVVEMISQKIIIAALVQK